MNKQERVAKAIKEVVSSMMDRVMTRVLVEDPFIKESHHASKPIYAALVPDEIFKGSHFERRFVTPFGGVWEKLAQVVALEIHGECYVGHTISGNIKSDRLRRIQEVLNGLEYSTKLKAKAKPDWDEELKYILEGKGELIPVSVICDIFVNNKKTGSKLAFELKGPLPNSDQTKVSKEKMFKLLAMDSPQVAEAYFALPYNPYGKKEDYKWGFPMRWFNMHNDSSVLIGNEFWDLIGGKGTYQNFIKEINTLGNEYRERIYREFLEIEAPLNSKGDLLK
ncbi:MAG: TdeIII family type II restriction endonuclease [Bacteroidetes bacterium]|uniref:TdeIII family type II restriction endonuclease n=1 Tax=Flavobacterium sp. TaxID=239 RepID=UPI002FD959B4|nr:TdeIII family type II restriction endonuclease [Bacteroidota bacterium]